MFRYVPHYRAPFYDLLRESLAAEDIELSLEYGDPIRDFDKQKRDGVSVPWGKRIRTISFPIGKRALYWQCGLRDALRSDLVIVEHANRLLLNHALLVAQCAGLTRVAFWGHGDDFQHRGERSLGARVRHWTAHRAHWWFAYTRLSAQVLTSHGTDPHRITIVNNALDTTPLVRAAQSQWGVSNGSRHADFGDGDATCVFVGSLYSAKRLRFLLAAASLIHRQIPGFRLIIIGDGPDRTAIEHAAVDAPWIHYVGPEYGSARVKYLAAASLLLMPGAVGLAILDSFACALPLVTTSVSSHGPEIDYLLDGVNGIMVEDFASVHDYADVVTAILRDGAMLARLRNGCIEAQRKYTLEAMTHRFTRGILEALEQ